MRPVDPSKRAICTRRVWPYPVGVMLLLPALCLAAEVRVVAVTPGRSADIVIERGAPITIEVGETVEEITLLRADRDGAVLSIQGITKALPLVADPASLAAAGGMGSVKLSADGRGHFIASGVVNGKPLRFLVDTGASLTTISRGDAERIGLRYRDGALGLVSTANGPAKGWRVSLDSVRVGRVTVRDVDAFVIDNDALPMGLLGMSYLDRFDIQRQGSSLVLRRRR